MSGRCNRASHKYLTLDRGHHYHNKLELHDIFSRNFRGFSLLSYEQPEMPFLKREGRVRIYYESHGQGTPLILSHGFSSSSGMWHGQIEPLTKAGYNLIIWDMRGHGRSAYPDDQSAYSEKHTVSDIAALLDEAGGSGCKAIVGGLSLGGYMSQAFYRDYPDRVEALLIIGKYSEYKSLANRVSSLFRRYRARLQKRQGSRRVEQVC